MRKKSNANLRRTFKKVFVREKLKTNKITDFKIN